MRTSADVLQAATFATPAEASVLGPRPQGHPESAGHKFSDWPHGAILLLGLRGLQWTLGPQACSHWGPPVCSHQLGAVALRTLSPHTHLCLWTGELVGTTLSSPVLASHDLSSLPLLMPMLGSVPTRSPSSYPLQSLVLSSWAPEA